MFIMKELRYYNDIYIIIVKKEVKSYKLKYSKRLNNIIIIIIINSNKDALHI